MTVDNTVEGVLFCCLQNKEVDTIKLSLSVVSKINKIPSTSIATWNGIIKIYFHILILLNFIYGNNSIKTFNLLTVYNLWI